MCCVTVNTTMAQQPVLPPAREVILQEFDPDTVRPDYIVFLVGARHSGKSVAMRGILQALSNKLDLAIAFSGTRDTLDDLRQHIQPCFLYEGFDDKAFDHIVETQKTLGGVKPTVGPDGMLTCPRRRRVGIILDDCMHDRKAAKGGETMRYLFNNGRHDDFFFMNCIQYTMDVQKGLRSQVDLVVAFPVTEDGLLEPLRENLLGCFKTADELRAAFASLKEHEALVYNRRAQREKLPYLFWYKAPYPTPKFIIGNDLFWRWYYMYFTRQDSSMLKKHIQARLRAAQDTPSQSKQNHGGGAGAGAATSAQPPLQSQPVVAVGQMPTAPPTNPAKDAGVTFTRRVARKRTAPLLAPIPPRPQPTVPPMLTCGQQQTSSRHH